MASKKIETKTRRVIGHKFGRGLLDSFSADKACELLISTEKAHPGEREVVFAGFCYWVLAPLDKTGIRRAMNILALRGLSATAQRHTKREGSVFQGDISFARDLTYRPLRDMMFGAQTPTEVALGTISRRAHRKLVKEREVDVRRLVVMMKVLDWAKAQHDQDPKQYLGPTAKRGSEAAARLLNLSDRLVQESWLPMRRSCALLYAAALVETDDGFTLLDHMLSDSALHKTHRQYLRSWFGYARSITDDIIGVMSFDHNVRSAMPNLKGIAKLNRRTPTMSGNEPQIIAEEFRRKRPLKA